ncbi:MAG: aspartate aminotransferase family protein [Candidatus Eisenbacteria bacterium]
MVETTIPAAPDPALAHEEVGLIAPTYPLPRLELARGGGARVWGADGVERLDFVSGIAVNAFGHAPAGLVRAISKQLKTLGQVSNLYANRPAIELAQKLVQLTGYRSVFFANSGAEGIESALKFCRARAHALGREGRGIVAFTGGFHGRTGFALSTTWNPPYRAPFEPLIPGVTFAPFNDVAALEGAIDQSTCGVIVEIVQGESGAIPATKKFLTALRARCDAAGALLVIDEVQTGVGRTGRFLAAEHFGVRADITVLSKALGGGLPLAAVLLDDAAAEALTPGMHGTTFGGNPACAAAGLWVVERVSKPSFLSRVRRNAKKLRTGLDDLVARHPKSLTGARGLGLLVAIELAADAGFDAPALVTAARAQGLLLVRGGDHAVRFLPPLTVTETEIADAIARADRALSDLESAPGAKEPA